MSFQERMSTFENEARGRLKRVLSTGNEKLMELDGALARFAKDDWSVPGMRRHIDELRARAESLRAAALKRANALPGEAVTRLATGTRAPIQTLANRLAEMAKKMEPPRPKPKPVEAEPVAEKTAKAS